MDSVVLLIGLIFLASALFLVFFVVFALTKVRRRNERRHNLARFLAVSHPEWN